MSAPTTDCVTSVDTPIVEGVAAEETSAGHEDAGIEIDARRSPMYRLG
jgi:hypothetical protein